MKKKTFGTLVTGAAIGAGLGLLFAPRKGSETRKILSDKIDYLCKKVKEIDYEDVRIQIEERIAEIKDELQDLDKEKVLEIAKAKSEEIKVKIDELAKYAKKKATPVVESAVEDLRKAAIKATKEITKKLEGKDKKKKTLIGILIVFDSLTMMILGTRVAAYCALLIPPTVLIIHIFTKIIKTGAFNKWFASFCVVLTLMNAGIIPYCPAYQNQQFDAADFTTLKMDDSIRESFRKGIEEGAEGFEPFSAAWVDYYVYMFEQYKFLMGVTQSVYYEYWYDYHVDPKFWVDLIFDYELEDRANARQVEKIFYNYKWQYLTTPQKLTGFTYSLFMWGGINIEQDFILQAYSFGYLGFPLIMGPWICLLLYVVYKFLLSVKYKKWTMFNIVTLMSLSLGIVTSYLSGHGLDQFTTNMFMTLLCAYLIQNTKKESYE